MINYVVECRKQMPVSFVGCAMRTMSLTYIVLLRTAHPTKNTVLLIISRGMNRRHLAVTISRRDTVFSGDTQSMSLIFVGQ